MAFNTEEEDMKSKEAESIQQVDNHEEVKAPPDEPKITRRGFLKYLGAIAVGFLGGAAWGATRSSEPRQANPQSPDPTPTKSVWDNAQIVDAPEVIRSKDLTKNHNDPESEVEMSNLKDQTSNKLQHIEVSTPSKPSR